MLAAEDLEAGTDKKRIHAEPTLPIFLKVKYMCVLCVYIYIGVCICWAWIMHDYQFFFLSVMGNAMPRCHHPLLTWHVHTHIYTRIDFIPIMYLGRQGYDNGGFCSWHQRDSVPLWTWLPMHDCYCQVQSCTESHLIWYLCTRLFLLPMTLKKQKRYGVIVTFDLTSFVAFLLLVYARLLKLVW